MATLNVLQAVRQALDEALAANEKVIVLGQDIGVKGGVFKATEGLHCFPRSPGHSLAQRKDSPVSEPGESLQPRPLRKQ